MSRVEDTVAKMSDADLGAVPRDSNVYTAAKLEQARRLFDSGKHDAGYEVFAELEKEGTRLGQLINQFKLLKGNSPENVVRVIDQKLKNSGKDPLTLPQREKATELAENSKAADLSLDSATDAWLKNPTTENARLAETALDTANAKAVELQRFILKYQPRSTASILK